MVMAQDLAASVKCAIHESSGALEETRQIAKAAHAQENQAELQQLSQQIAATPPPAAETTGTELTNGDGEGFLEGVLDVLGDAWDRISDLF
jgi:hypothetical protein